MLANELRKCWVPSVSVNEKVPKVLMIGPSLDSHGGMSSFASAVLEEASKRDDILINYFATVIPGSKVKKLIYGLKSVLGFLRTVANYDVVHINYATGLSMGRKRLFELVARARRKKIVIHSHGSEDEHRLRKGDRHLVARHLSFVAHSDALIVISDHWKNLYISLGIPKQKISVLRNGVRLLSGEEPVAVERDSVRLLYLGRLEDEKGVMDLLEALRLMESRLPSIKYKLILAGTGLDSDLARYESEAKRLKCDVEFVGWVEGADKDGLTKGSDIFVLPSHSEVLPMSMLEAMGAGVACIASRVGAIPSVIDDEMNGLLVDAGNCDDLALAIEQLIVDGRKRRSLATAGWHTVKDGYSIGATVDDLRAIYLSILES